MNSYNFVLSAVQKMLMQVIFTSTETAKHIPENIKHKTAFKR